VDSADEPPQPLEGVGILELGRAAAAARIEREAVTGVVMQRGAAISSAATTGISPRGELAGELVLLQDLLVRPARRAVELGDEEAGVAERAALVLLEPDLVDPVLVAVQGELPAIGQEAHALDGVRTTSGVRPA